MSARKKEPAQSWICEVAIAGAAPTNPFGMDFHSAIAARGACENHSRYAQTGGDVGATKPLGWTLKDFDHWVASIGDATYSVRRRK